MAYELIFGYMHCRGKTVYPAGVVDTLEEACRWVRERTRTGGRRPAVPEKDPIRWCPVRHCHMKRQKPWFGYRER